MDNNPKQVCEFAKPEPRKKEGNRRLFTERKL
jgi:hypothetical protein